MAEKKSSSIALPLADDLIVELLLRLPVKSLLRFRCVSKEWLRLIDSTAHGSIRNLYDQQPNKIKTPFLLSWYHKIEPNNRRKRKSLCLSVIDVVSGKLLSDFKLKFGSSHSAVHRSISCHGLVCFAANYTYKQLYVCNPSTHEVVKIPKSPTARAAHLTIQFGFGFLPPTNQYKIVSWFNIDNGDHHETRCEIFTLRDGGKPSSSCWRELANHPKLCLNPLHISINGLIYWLILGQEKFPVLAFDLEREDSIIIPPPLDSHGRKDPYLMELRGSVFMAQQCTDQPSMTKIWMLKKEDQKYCWLQQYKIFVPISSSLIPIPTSKGEEQLLLMMYSLNKISILHLNIKGIRRGSEKEWKELDCIQVYEKDWKEFFVWSQPSLYFESFFSLNPQKKTTVKVTSRKRKASQPS